MSLLPSDPDPDEAIILPTAEGYDRWSAVYDDEDNPLVRLEEPILAERIGEVRGLRALDVGCGTGRWALRLAAAGADVTGVDFSPGMLGRARAAPASRGVRFLHHDLDRPWPLRDAAFDRVVCCLVLDHVAALDRFFAEMRRVCRPDGRIVVSVMHPAMMLRGVQARFIDPATGRDTRPRSAPNRICDYVMASVRAGLILEQMSEHAVDERLAAASPRAAKYLGWPLLLTLQMRPPPALLLEVQPGRAPSIPPCDAGVPGGGVPWRSGGQGMDGEDPDPRRPACDGGYPG